MTYSYTSSSSSSSSSDGFYHSRRSYSGHNYSNSGHYSHSGYSRSHSGRKHRYRRHSDEDHHQERRRHRDSFLSDSRHELLRLINAKRAKRGLCPVHFEPCLNKVARRHNRDMIFRLGRLSHTGSDRSTLRTRLRDAGYKYDSAWQNLTKGPKNVEDAFNNWMKSKEARRNLLAHDAKEIGMAVGYHKRGRMFWTLIVADPKH